MTSFVLNDVTRQLLILVHDTVSHPGRVLTVATAQNVLVMDPSSKHRPIGTIYYGPANECTIKLNHI